MEKVNAAVEWTFRVDFGSKIISIIIKISRFDKESRGCRFDPVLTQ